MLFSSPTLAGPFPNPFEIKNICEILLAEAQVASLYDLDKSPIRQNFLKQRKRSKKMKKMTLLITALLFGVSSVVAAAEVEDYSSTIDVFRVSPVVIKFLQ
jgi:hypothetical protein